MVDAVVEVHRIPADPEPALEIEPGRVDRIELGDKQEAAERLDGMGPLMEPGKDFTAGFLLP